MTLIDFEVDCLQLQVEASPQNVDLSVDYDEAFDMKARPNGPAQRPLYRKGSGINVSRRWRRTKKVCGEARPGDQSDFALPVVGFSLAPVERRRDFATWAK